MYLAGVRHLHIALGHANPFNYPMERLRLLIKGARRESAKERPERKNLQRPVTADAMRVLRQSWEREEPRSNGRLLWAACCVGWFGFLRAGEFTVPKGALFDPALHLSLADVQVDNWRSPEWVKVRMKQSKTDPFRLGATICLGRTGEDLCPVAAIVGYLVEGRLRPGPLFVFADGRPLRKDALVLRMQQAPFQRRNRRRQIHRAQLSDRRSHRGGRRHRGLDDPDPGTLAQRLLSEVHTPPAGAVGSDQQETGWRVPSKAKQ